ncbi:MAG: hypothetical protein HKM93_15795 [Desulfobacteraceae bacterium]|nr:hypothetical protein [Desulfobacteraceae bacterium]
MATPNSINTQKECIDFNFKIPCELADRVQNYANENNTTPTNVVIEALDTFMRRAK